MCIAAKNLYTYHMHISLTKQKAIDFKLQFKQNIIYKNVLFNRQSIESKFFERNYTKNTDF